ncbi:hypothetical protein THAOC_07628, partial [Thalassiosira oceanica]
SQLLAALAGDAFEGEGTATFTVGPVADGSAAVAAVGPVAPPAGATAGGQVELTLVLQLDEYSSETSWSLESPDGTMAYTMQRGHYESYASNKKVETIQVPPGRYRFRITDERGDGICCSAGNGYYAMYEGNGLTGTQLFYGAGNFGDEAEHIFEVGTFSEDEAQALPVPPDPPGDDVPSEDTSSSQTEDGLHLVEMSILLDSAAAETGFVLSWGDVVILERKPGYFEGKDSTTVTESIYLPAGEYILTLLDTAGDGFCCSKGAGFYSLLHAGELILFGQATFEYEHIETFEIAGGGGPTAVSRKKKFGLRGTAPSSYTPIRERLIAARTKPQRLNEILAPGIPWQPVCWTGEGEVASKALVPQVKFNVELFSVPPPPPTTDHRPAASPIEQLRSVTPQTLPQYRDAPGVVVDVLGHVVNLPAEYDPPVGGGGVPADLLSRDVVAGGSGRGAAVQSDAVGPLAHRPPAPPGWARPSTTSSLQRRPSPPASRNKQSPVPPTQPQGPQAATRPMARTCNAVKRQRVATVESALFNPDVVFLLAALLDARDLCQVSLTCKTLGGKRANAVDGLSLVEEASRRLFECASDWERSCLPKYPDEGWIELFRHLMMLRSKLTFDQLVGSNIKHGEERSIIRAAGQYHTSSALCSNQVMRSGRHFVLFTGDGNFGVVRPVQINRSDFGEDELKSFYPVMGRFWEYLLGQRTTRWTDSNVHFCCVSIIGNSFWCDWTSSNPPMRIGGLQSNAPIGLLLDLDEGTLSMYQNGQRLATLKDGLSGEYCWYADVSGAATISIERGLAPGEAAVSAIPYANTPTIRIVCGATLEDNNNNNNNNLN